MRWATGVPIALMTIVGVDGVRGRVSGAFDDLDSDADYFNRIVVLVAGHIGEKHHLGESKGLKGSDRRKVDDCAACLADNANARSLIVRAAEVEAEHLLRKHEQAFRALVDALLARSVLSGGQVTEIIERET
ncbi:hypothetical protein AS156_19200 [Bradyrhizobium macuxiense]|uniref:Peptidase M41 domain-containing protein n=1 Tax=Bradyrhizobium macuxiense TaxID=1755647 RepID=A0A109JFL6_9BRAD|nr:hypothetical protein [Bradyrhizobium macuxiense]KWV48038.1 hypothetical protein AS156_19200 [Bradyrhizobium macuxiense]